MASDPKLPRGVLMLAADAIMTAQNADDDEPEQFEANLLARVALSAALPVIQRDAVRQAARQILDLRPERDLYGSYYMMGRCLKRLARGEPLPDIPPKEAPDATRP
jgi:hypothetical protein